MRSSTTRNTRPTPLRSPAPADLTKAGAGTLHLTGTNTYTGATLISAGIRKANSSLAFGLTSAVTVTGTLDTSGFTQTLGSLTGAGALILGTTASNTLTVGTD